VALIVGGVYRRDGRRADGRVIEAQGVEAETGRRAATGAVDPLGPPGVPLATEGVAVGFERGSASPEEPLDNGLAEDGASRPARTSPLLPKGGGGRALDSR